MSAVIIVGLFCTFCTLYRMRAPLTWTLRMVSLTISMVFLLALTRWSCQNALDWWTSSIEIMKMIQAWLDTETTAIWQCTHTIIADYVIPTQPTFGTLLGLGSMLAACLCVALYFPFKGPRTGLTKTMSEVV
jgi:hypothetical protein